MRHKSDPKIVQEWVRKNYTIHPLRGSDIDLALI
jgi:hypothetical protein